MVSLLKMRLGIRGIISSTLYNNVMLFIYELFIAFVVGSHSIKKFPQTEPYSI